MRAVLADDVVVEWPASSERIVGAERFVGFDAAYPEGWRIDVLRLVEDGDVVVSARRTWSGCPDEPHGGRRRIQG